MDNKGGLCEYVTFGGYVYIVYIYIYVYIYSTDQMQGKKACLHLIGFNGVRNLVSEPVPGEAHQCALMRFGASTLLNLHIME